MREYSYRCHDFSLLTTDFKKWLVAPLVPFIPWAVPANIITIISNIFVYVGFIIALLYQGPLIRVAIAVCLLLYLIGDHLDGMQAKKTDTGSALGEFCDHYLDAFNNGIILYTAFLVFEITNPLLIAVVLTTSYLAHMSVFYEQFKTGWLTFEKLGSLEAVLLILLIIGASGFNPVHTLLTHQVIYSFTIIELVFFASAIGAVLTFITTTLRTPDKGKAMWLFVLGIFILTILSVNKFSALQLFVLITLYASLYVGLIMKGHLVDGIEQFPDMVIPGVLLVLQFISQVNFDTIYLTFSAYLLARICLLVIQTFNALKIYWVWSNPPS